MDELTKYLSGLWDGFNVEVLDRVLSTKTPFVTIAMLSWLRPEKLVRTLGKTLSAVEIPINLCLRVQGRECLDEKYKDRIVDLGQKFHVCDIQFTMGNLGTGKPRHDIVERALTKFDTPYVWTLDSDMIVPRGGLEALVTLLEQHKELGAVSLSCTPTPMACNLFNGRLVSRSIKGPLDYVVTMGSATKLTRREVFDTCELDQNYYIGWGDFDFCLQMKEARWKSAILSIPQLNAWNDGGGPPEYMKTRYNRNITQRSRDYFIQKWGFPPN